MVYGITINDRHSYNDFGLTIKSKKIGNPKKKKIIEDVPFMNGVYDFSLLYGEQTYSERRLEYTFNFNEENKIEMNIKKMQVLEWLAYEGKQPLYDDAIPDFYFLAEVEENDFDEVGCYGELKVVFNAYPYKLYFKDEGDDIWDEFNFNLDYAQDTKFIIEKGQNITLLNPGLSRLIPIVKSTSNFDIVKDGITYKFNPGVTKEWRFVLNKGFNNMTIIGTGKIEFIFKREVL
ncbi:phage tail protein [Clostridium perfringens]|uniref:phage tail protein n=1 Tax=Clostridium perfringens TaxID=1502 RepID=UPI001B841AF3|nr:phage tail protein [Clostridium perfringens]HBC2034852.1 phage tail protein [Clostridium perfringens]HBC2058000.1 phage tail protein [Clostridium perfringens]HBC2072203.1 phage tail protein [Clostridium perfringens]